MVKSKERIMVIIKWKAGHLSFFGKTTKNPANSGKCIIQLFSFLLFSEFEMTKTPSPGCLNYLF